MGGSQKLLLLREELTAWSPEPSLDPGVWMCRPSKKKDEDVSRFIMGHMSVLLSEFGICWCTSKNAFLCQVHCRRFQAVCTRPLTPSPFHTAFPRCRVSACILWHQHLVLHVAQSHVVLWLIRRNCHKKENTTCCGLCRAVYQMLHDSLLGMISAMKSRNMGWVGHTAWTGERCVCTG